MEALVVLIYKFALICLTCYMTVNYGWYWIFLLFLGVWENK